MSRERRDYFSRWFAIVWLLMFAGLVLGAVDNTGPLRVAYVALALLTGVCAVRVLTSAIGRTAPPPWFGNRG
jgi:hypothetical protein